VKARGKTAGGLTLSGEIDSDQIPGGLASMHHGDPPQ
jgi:hypothetical protein